MSELYAFQSANFQVVGLRTDEQLSEELTKGGKWNAEQLGILAGEYCLAGTSQWTRHRRVYKLALHIQRAMISWFALLHPLN